MDDKYMLQINTKKSIPNFVYFFLTEINKRLIEKKFDASQNNNCVIVVLSETIIYNWDAIKIVQKHFSNDDWKCTMTNFHKSDNRKYNIYTWTFERKKLKKNAFLL